MEARAAQITRLLDNFLTRILPRRDSLGHELLPSGNPHGEQSGWAPTS
jgi:hypothetical protein